jgi:prepilin-type N-terminal cleavage/methylation domain-containing protein
VPVCNRSGRQAFSLIDLLVAITIIGVLAAIILAGIARTRSAAQSARCLADLHSISVAFNECGMDCGNRYPDPMSAGSSWESLLMPYMSQSMIFACPADNEIFPSVGSSYDWRDTPDPLTTLAGRRMADARSDAVLAFETLPGWHGRHLMNALLVNGAVLVMNDESCLSDLHVPVRYAHRPTRAQQ